MKSIVLSAIAMAIISCASPKGSNASPKESDQTPADTLRDRLAALVEEGKIMFGHQDDYMYGHSWRLVADATEYVQSDVFASCGQYPAVYGMDLGGIEMDWPSNLDSNPFDHMRASAVAHHERGGVITFSWHPRNPLTGGDAWDVSSDQVVASILPGGEKHELFMTWLSKAADFMGSIKTADGELVPVIFRPWHEHTGSWFWWGQKLCTTEQYKTLWKLTYDYMMVERGMTNLLWAYSPGAGELKSPEVFGERYPGDDIIDMVGFDCYQYAGNEVYMADLKNALDITAAFAAEHGKLMAITETGYEGVKDAKWWTEVLYPVMKDYPVSYVLLWRNACEDNMQHHFYAPFPGHESVEDFRTFVTLKQMMLI
jgi:mannan endo-1,4-beta-mannosidase